MEVTIDQRLSTWRALTKHLSTLIITKNIPIGASAERLVQLFEMYVRDYGLKDLADLLLIYHKIKGHQESKLKLKCGSTHCIECYYAVTCRIIQNNESMECTCSYRVPPNFRHRIEQEYNRIQSLKVDCKLCLKRKDKMEFAVIANHKCPACSSCIIQSYKYIKGYQNSCPVCHQQYDEESEILARAACETVIPPEEQLEYYSEICIGCNHLKDSRTFQVVCEQSHEYCESCISEFKKSKAATCNYNQCGLALSIP